MPYFATGVVQAVRPAMTFPDVVRAFRPAVTSRLGSAATSTVKNTLLRDGCRAGLQACDDLSGCSAGLQACRDEPTWVGRYIDCEKYLTSRRVSCRPSALR